MLALLGTVLLVVAIIPAHGILLAWRRVPWQRSELGKVLFGKSLTIAIVLDLALIGGVLYLAGYGRPLWFEVLRLCAFAAVSVALWKQWGAYRAILRTAAVQAAVEVEEGTHGRRGAHTDPA